jgi:hypothetical protein
MTFYHLEKFSFSTRIHLLGVVIAALIVQHRLFTASVSHGGHFFQLLPAFCDIFSKRKKTCVFFLRYFRISGWLISLLLSWVSNQQKNMGILCILYGVGLTHILYLRVRGG